MILRYVLLALALLLIVSGCAGATRALDEPPLAPQDDWARDRVEAVLALYNFTDQGAAEIRELRVRHMLGRPGWFGSTGYRNYVGIGASRPSSIVHELSHSFWGAFPVEGRPELSWDVPPDAPISPGIAALRDALEDFIEEPPDEYEPLRARLRQIPDLIDGPFPGLYHLGEAEVVYYTGGNLNLVPPVLRPFYSAWLNPGPFATYTEAAEWYLSLPRDQRRIAGAYHGIGSLPLEGYAEALDAQASVDPALARVVRQEERQRLIDFVEQFDLYFKSIENEPVVADFRFWRGYIRGMEGLNRTYPDILGNASGQGAQLKRALDFLTQTERTPAADRPEYVIRRVSEDRFLLKFVSAVDHITLVKIVSASAEAGQGQGVRQVREALQPDHLMLLDNIVRVLALPPDESTAAFSGFIEGLSRKHQGRMNFILEVMTTIDRKNTARVLDSMPPSTAMIVMKRGPAYTRFLMEPEDLVRVLGYGGTLDEPRLVELAKLMNEYVSASPSVDLKFQSAVYRRILDFSRSPEGSPEQALKIFLYSGLLVEPFLKAFPREASELIAADLPTAAWVLQKANPVRMPPARAIYRLIQADPAVAARLTLTYEALGEEQAVREALVFFAHDGPRARRQPGLALPLANNGLYLQELSRLRGEAWLGARLAEAFQATDARRGPALASLDTRSGLAPQTSLLDAYRETLAAGLAAMPPQDRSELQRVLESVLG